MQSVLQKSPALVSAIATVRSTIKQTPDTVLARMYRTIAQTTHDSTTSAEFRDHWAKIIEILNISSDTEIANEFKGWFEKSIEASDPSTTKQFLEHVLNGIIATSRGN